MALAFVVWASLVTFCDKKIDSIVGFYFKSEVLFNFVNEGNNNVILLMMTMTKGHIIRFLIIRFFFFKIQFVQL